MIKCVFNNREVPILYGLLTSIIIITIRTQRGSDLLSYKLSHSLHTIALYIVYIIIILLLLYILYT